MDSDTKLTGAFGSKWTAHGCGPCRKCRAESDRNCAAFDRDVFFGLYNARGYTPAEWAEYQRKYALDSGKR